MDFMLKDSVILLAGILLIGGVVLLILVVNKLFKGTDTVPRDLQETEEQSPQEQLQNESDVSLLEAHLNSISEDIVDIKKKLEKLDKLDKIEKIASAPAAKTATAESSEDIQNLKDQLTKINAKMDAIYHVLSSFGKE